MSAEYKIPMIVDLTRLARRLLDRVNLHVTKVNKLGFMTVEALI